MHRPHVAGIHGREDDGAFSIVLSGGYEDDAVSLSVLFCSFISFLGCGIMAFKLSLIKWF